MRIAIVAESFLPQINGVTNSVLRVAEQLRREGHELLIIAPDDPRGVPSSWQGTPIITVASLPMPGYHQVRIAATHSARMRHLLADFAPDVVHVAAPLVLGSAALAAAKKLGIARVALFQTDLPGYLSRYLIPAGEPMAWRIMRRIHGLATLTLAPSTATRQRLVDHGIAPVSLWGRGVDTERFDPRRRDEALHHRWAPQGQCVVGYLGRLAPEKSVDRLSAVQGLDGVRLVVVGEGPLAATLRDRLPDAVFTGAVHGAQVARHMASFDVFVHPGELETFGQTLQEAGACAVPVVAPRVGGPIDIVRAGYTGLLYPPGDVRALRAQVAALAADPIRRGHLGEAARSAMACRTWQALTAQLVEHYRTAIRLNGDSDGH